MKTCLIIPIYKQAKYLYKILDGITKQTVMPDIIYLMLDRPTPEELSTVHESTGLYDLNVKIIEVNTLPKYMPRGYGAEPFLAGYVRNKGVEQALADDCDIFIFIDGDCVPQKDLVSSHVNKCNKSIPVISVGRRRESKYNWRDQREVTNNLMHLNLFSREGVLINNVDLLKNCLIVWTCNLAINKNAIGLIYKFNHRYYGLSELFNSIFLGEWGGEDSFLGITAWYCKIFITTVGELSSGIEHIDHPRPDSKYTINHKDYFLEQVENLKKKVVLNPLSIDFYG